MATENVAYNMDCMEHMKSLPDDYYDLVIADPPYGAGLTEGGGCKGWFTKYHQEEQTQPREPIDRHNLRGRFARYDDSSQTVNVEREREREAPRSTTASEIQAPYSSGTSVIRTGGTWAEKYGKKS